MIGRLARLGVMGWLATKAYQKLAETPKPGARPGPSSVPKHMEVVGSDGGHVGIVDGIAIKLTRTDPTAGGQHHLIPWDQAGEVRDGKLFLNVTAGEALRTEKTVVG